MKKLIIMAITVLVSTSAFACTAFFKHDYVSGQSRICMYNHLGSDYAYTIKSYEVCPVTLDVRH
jgi:hypothetical protein